MPHTILALHAHPDDESSKGAGTVARLVDEGVRAVLVTATGGEAGDILNAAMDHPNIASRLPEIRTRELMEAAKTIGYDEVVMLGYRDSGMPDSADNRRPDAFCNQSLESVLGKVVEVIRREKPAVVLGYDSHEFYPHPDHLRIHELTLELVAAAASPDRYREAGDPWQIEKLYAPVFSGERIRALHEAMIERTGESPFGAWLERVADYNVPERRLMRFDVTGYTETARDALRSHRTQVDPDGFWFAVPTEVVEVVYPWEDFEVLYTRGVWDPLETHLFSGLEA